MNDFTKTLKSWFLSLQNFRIDPRVFVFLFFLAISTIFWFLSALSKDYTSTIALPVEYTKFPKDKVLVGSLPDHLNVQVNGYGFTLMQIKMGMIREAMSLRVTELSLVTKSDDKANAYYYLTEFSRNVIAEKLPSDVKVLNIKPDSIIFRFDEVVAKTVPVNKEVFSFDFRDQYMQTGPVQIKPDSVKLWGPGSRLDTIEVVEPVKKHFSDLHNNVLANIPLEEIRDVRMKPRKINLSMQVSEFTEKIVKMPVFIRNLPGDTNVKLFPDNVRVTFHVGLQQYARVKPVHFKAVVDYEDIRSGISNKVRVRLTKKPDYIRNIGVYPEYLEYIIEK